MGAGDDDPGLGDGIVTELFGSPMNVAPGNTMKPPLPDGPTYTGSRQFITRALPPAPDAGGSKGGYEAVAGPLSGITTGAGVEGGGLVSGDSRNGGGVALPFDGVAVGPGVDTCAVGASLHRLLKPLSPSCWAGPHPTVVVARIKPPTTTRVSALTRTAATARRPRSD